jgi:tetratricopeptide (TPR) repeat protein
VARNLEGNALQKLQQLEPAQATYGEAMRLAPRYIAPRFNLGLLDLRAGRAPQALAAFDQIARATPDYPNIFLVRAEAHRRAHDDVAALADLEEQVRRHPDSADGWFHLGQALAERDRERSNSALCRAGTLGHREAAALCRADPITGSGDPGRARPTENRVGP